MKTKLVVTIALAFLTLAASGCDKASKMAQEFQESATQKLQDAQDEAVAKGGGNTQKALKNYIDAENRLINSMRRYGSYEEILAVYKKQKFGESAGKAPKRPNLYFDASAFKSASESLQEAAAVNLPAEYAELDEAGKAAAQAIQPFSKTLEEMDRYLTSKAYLDDDFKKGAELDATIISQAEAFIPAFNKMSEASTKVEVIRNNKTVENLKAKGEMVRGLSYQAYGNALEFLIIATNSDTKAPEVQEKLSDVIKKMAATMDELHAEIEKAGDKVDSRVKSAEEDLNKLLGDMRKAKERKYSQSSLSDFVQDYNRFVQFTLNMGSLDH